MRERDLAEREELVGAAHVVQVGDAGGGGDGADALERRCRDGAARALGADPAVQALGLGEDPAEVVGADAGDDLSLAHGSRDALGRLRECAIAGEAAVLLVEPAEAVEVDEHERQRALVALRAANLGAELLVEGAVVGQVRQRVARAERGEAGACVGVGDRTLRDLGERGERLRVGALADEHAPGLVADADRSGAGNRPGRRRTPVPRPRSAPDRPLLPESRPAWARPARRRRPCRSRRSRSGRATPPGRAARGRLPRRRS